jgi:hypothetical protein
MQNVSTLLVSPAYVFCPLCSASYAGQPVEEPSSPGGPKSSDSSQVSLTFLSDAAGATSAGKTASSLGVLRCVRGHDMTRSGTGARACRQGHGGQAACWRARAGGVAGWHGEWALWVSACAVPGGGVPAARERLAGPAASADRGAAGARLWGAGAGGGGGVSGTL